MPTQAQIELYRRLPMIFRQDLTVDGPNGRSIVLSEVMSDVQRADFEVRDPCLRWLADVREPKGVVMMPPAVPKIKRFFVQRSRGFSKTTDVAIDLAWLLTFCRRKMEGVVCAEDKEQATFLRDQFAKVVQWNEWLHSYIDVQRKAIINKHNDASIRFLSRDTASSFGITPDFVVCDEFTHWQQEEFFNSVISSYAKKEGMLIICCNAGYGCDWKWRVRENAKTDPRWYFSAPEGAAPWQSTQNLEEQRRLLLPKEYKRLWLNQWQTDTGEFVSLEEADACIDSSLRERNKAEQDGWSYVAALDYAEKVDRTVGVVGHLYNDQIIVDRMDVLAPEMTVDGVIRVEWCENWIRQIAREFGGEKGRIFFVCDKWQLLYIMQRLRMEGYFIEEFDFRSGVGNWEISHLLRQMIVHKKVSWYEGCGAIKDRSGHVWTPTGSRDDLSTELSRLSVKTIGSSRWRFEHHKGEHDDRAFALGALCRFIVLHSDPLSWDFVMPQLKPQ